MKKLKVKDFKRIDEPVLIKIKKNQYKIDLGGKSYYTKVVPFSKIKKKFSKKSSVLVKYLLNTPDEVLSALKKEFDEIDCILDLREDVRLSLYNTNEVLDGREKYYYLFYFADETYPQSIHPVFKEVLLDYLKDHDDMFIPFINEKVFKEQWLKNLNENTNFILYEENEEYKEHLINDLKLPEDKIFSY